MINTSEAPIIQFTYQPLPYLERVAILNALHGDSDYSLFMQIEPDRWWICTDLITGAQHLSLDQINPPLSLPYVNRIFKKRNEYQHWKIGAITHISRIRPRKELVL